MASMSMSAFVLMLMLVSVSAIEFAFIIRDLRYCGIRPVPSSWLPFVMAKVTVSAIMDKDNAVIVKRRKTLDLDCDCDCDCDSVASPLSFSSSRRVFFKLQSLS